MNDKGAGVIEQYDISVIKTLRGRGAIIVETDQGYKRVMEYSGTYGRLEYMDKLLWYIWNSGFKNVDLVMKNKEGMLFSNDNGGDRFIITDWFYGNECDVKVPNNIYEGVQMLGKIHKITGEGFENCGLENVPITDDLIAEYEKHNQELKRVQGYIRGRKHKSEFEYDVLRHIEEYLDYGKMAAEDMKGSQYSRLEKEAVSRYSICHGNYNYHNIIFDKSKVAVVNFDRSGRGILIKDLYLFFRKVMEKHNWDIVIGHQVIDLYNKIRPIPEDEYNVFKIMLTYPEKYWKVVNHYYNGNKSWIPDKNMEKLKLIYYQQKKKEAFLNSM